VLEKGLVVAHGKSTDLLAALETLARYLGV